jgi:hypothetical protein
MDFSGHRTFWPCRMCLRRCSSSCELYLIHVPTAPAPILLFQMQQLTREPHPVKCIGLLILFICLLYVRTFSGHWPKIGKILNTVYESNPAIPSGASYSLIPAHIQRGRGYTPIFRKSYPCNRPWKPIGLWDVKAPTFSLENRLTDIGKIVSLTHRPPFTTLEDSWYSFLSEAESTPGAIVRLEWLVKR